jgi:hypothetical protein
MDDKLRPCGVGNPEGGQADAGGLSALRRFPSPSYDADSRTKVPI